MRRRTVTLWLGPLVLTAACGSRTGLLVPVVEDGTVSDAGPDVTEQDVAPFPVGPNECADAGATLVYLITADSQLMSFDPPTTTFHAIGTIACPDPQGTSPFSMAVSRSGVAYVVYESGYLFRVSTLTAACEATSFVPDDAVFAAPFGTGFSADAPDAGTDGGETLYVASCPLTAGGSPGPSSLASIDTTTFALHAIGQLSPVIENAELTGSAAGALFAFWAPDESSNTSIVQIDKATAGDTPVATLPGVDLGNAWAFAFWGGDFYLFTAPDGVGSASLVTRYRPADGSITQVGTAPGVTVVGAGVSTCAPQQ
jgi:hypothetical protein